MIRWSYVIPRLLLLGALLLALWVGLNPLVRWTLIRMGQTATSAKVEIGRAETSLLEAELRLSDVRIADPQSPMKNLVEADEVLLGLDSNSLLRRKLIVREGRVTGLRFDTRRETSGALDPAADWRVELPHARFPGLGHEGFEQLAQILQQKLVEHAEQLESVPLARELCRRWPAEYARMEARADSLRRRVDGLRALSERLRDDSLARDPLQALDACQQAAIDLQQIEREITQLRGEIDRLRAQVLRDKDAVVRAQQRDLENIREIFRLASLDAEALSDYLLGPELSETVRTVAEWVQWGRKYVLPGVDPPEPARGRGVDVRFAGIAHRPDFLVESLVLDGEARLGRRRVRFLGTAAGITTQPELYGRPLVLKARINGPTEIALEAVLDRTGKTPHDRVTISCPGIEQRERVLGRPGQFAVAVSPGSTHLWASLDLEGDRLSGQILVQQQPAELVPDLAAVPVRPRLAESLQAAMSEVRQIRVVVDLAGTLEKPEWGLRSNLGPQLAGALGGLFERELEARREELAAYLRRRVQEDLGRLDSLIGAEHGRVLAKLDLNDTQIHQLNRTIARRLQLPGLPVEGLPRGMPFRF
jgi:uncharacterized protein (TIGR03545 family)